jgi:nitroreductase
MKKPGFSPLSDFREYPPEEMQARAKRFLADMKRRRSVRHFSDRPVSREVVEDCLRAANSAPSGANRQPWHFVVVADAETKGRIRGAAEKEEREFYERRAPEEWLEALRPLGTDEHKPFLETAPYLIAIFAQLHGVDAEGNQFKHYYVNESVGIATGMLISALHLAGLATLTHTPSPMRFLNEILDRPGHERPYLLLVVGYPAEDAVVPDLEKRPLEQVSTFV